MFNSATGWMLGFGAIALVWITLLIKRGPKAALGAAVAISFPFPVWVEQDIAGIPFTVRTAICCLAMLGYAFHPRGKIISPLTLLDLCIALICLNHILVDTYVSGFSVATPLLAYGEWALPYVAGRYAVKTQEDLKFIAPWVVCGLVLISICVMVESLTDINVFEVLFGKRPVVLGHPMGRRFGIRRAFGPTTHSLFLGMLLVVMMPWLLCLWKSAKSNAQRLLLSGASLLSAVGCLCSIARTPVITLGLTLAVLTVIRRPMLRLPFVMSVVSGIVAFVLFPNQITDSVSRWTGGGDKIRIIEVDGKAVEVSSSRSRLVVFSIYSEALSKGVTGYGSQALKTFPPQIPYIQGKKNNTDVKPIDNGYILMTLRFGWIGGFLFFVMFLTAILSAVLLYRENSDSLFLASLGSLYAVIAFFSMLLVWMSYDFGLPILWTFGCLSGLTSTSLLNRRPLTQSFKR
jgi:hypothetical protein